MIFRKKTKNASCSECKAKFDQKFNFCPICGANRIEQEDPSLGMLGRNDISDNEFAKNLNMQNNLGTMDRFLSTIMQSMMRNMMREMDHSNPKSNPNSIKIKIGIPQQRKPLKEPKSKIPTHEQLTKFAQLPKTQATTQIRRLNDKIVYELEIPGILSPDDILVSRLESGYEIKAIGEAKIGEKKVFVNSLPITLPIKSFTINPDRLLIEFASKEEMQ